MTYAVYDADCVDAPLRRCSDGADAITFARQRENGRGYVVLRRADEPRLTWAPDGWVELYRSPR